MPGFKHHEVQQTIEELFLVKNRIVDDRATALAASVEALLAMCFPLRALLVLEVAHFEHQQLATLSREKWTRSWVCSVFCELARRVFATWVWMLCTCV